MNYLYLAIDLGSIAIPFAASFHPAFPFYNEWRAAGVALVGTAFVFLIWDYLFTEWGVWGFNDTYLTGIRIAELPIEEILFFICIPYACLFTYYCVHRYFPLRTYSVVSQRVALALSLMLFAISCNSIDKLYTSTTFILTSLLLCLHFFKLRSSYLASFFVSYILILAPFFITNGILTGTGIPGEVVWYDDSENLGIRLGTIPVEDSVYALLLTLLTTTIFESRRGRSPIPS